MANWVILSCQLSCQTQVANCNGLENASVAVHYVACQMSASCRRGIYRSQVTDRLTQNLCTAVQGSNMLKTLKLGLSYMHASHPRLSAFPSMSRHHNLPHSPTTANTDRKQHGCH